MCMHVCVYVETVVPTGNPPEATADLPAYFGIDLQGVATALVNAAATIASTQGEGPCLHTAITLRKKT